MSKVSSSAVGKAVLAAAAILVAYAAARHSIDFDVYYIAARAMLNHSGPMYGPQSALGWPLVYRYPPLFLLLFTPFTLLPLRLGSFVWAMFKLAVLCILARNLIARLPWGRSRWTPVLALLPSLPYLIVEFHYGNAQFLVFACVAAALLWCDTRPVPAALVLGLGISLKVWPLFFVPYLAAKPRLRVAGFSLLFAAALTAVPAAHFGWRGNISLLHQWFDQEFGVASSAGEPSIITFPSQSLHGELMRYFVSLDYSKLPDAHYPKFNVAALDPQDIERVWMILGALGYAALLLLARRGSSQPLAADAVAFCALALLEPFTQRTDLVVLFWPITVGASVLARQARLPAWVRASLWTALVLMVLQPLVPTSAMQRSFQVLGVDFALVCLLCAGLAGFCLHQTKQPAHG